MTDASGTRVPVVGHVRSADGTTIAFERTGSGPPLVLVHAAGHFRGLSTFDGLIGLLAADFTVYHYDRRGRGDSTDTPPYAVDREVEDLAALIAEAGGRAAVYAFSSGGLLALHAASRGLPITRMALLEPPIATEEERSEQAAFTAELADLVADQRRGAAVEHFLSGIGVPEEVLDEMRGGAAWPALESVAHTLVHDSCISEAMSDEVLRSAAVPTLVIDSQGSGDDLTGMAATIAARLPHSSHRSLVGEWHGVADEVVAPVLVEFLTQGR